MNITTTLPGVIEIEPDLILIQEGGKRRNRGNVKELRAPLTSG